MTKKICAVVIGLFLVFAGGCGERQIPEGLVVAKNHRDAYTVLVMMPIYTQNGTILVPYWIHHPERFILSIEQYDEHGNPIDVDDVYVTEDFYESIDEGVWYEPSKESLDTARPRKVRK